MTYWNNEQRFFRAEQAMEIRRAAERKTEIEAFLASGVDLDGNPMTEADRAWLLKDLACQDVRAANARARAAQAMLYA